MRNGVEIRKNGNIIIHCRDGRYWVSTSAGVESKGNPWDRLCNARRDANGEYPVNFEGV